MVEAGMAYLSKEHDMCRWLVSHEGAHRHMTRFVDMQRGLAMQPEKQKDIVEVGMAYLGKEHDTCKQFLVHQDLGKVAFSTATFAIIHFLQLFLTFLIVKHDQDIEHLVQLIVAVVRECHHWHIASELVQKLHMLWVVF
ncbi:hypothetical protein F5141DRAFT_1060827 [Pisolithus sp. B1]|nr:hypothetical protein F5141DRAFT_1060827 [Pisolithus sp. B1]